MNKMLRGLSAAAVIAGVLLAGAVPTAAVAGGLHHNMGVSIGRSGLTSYDSDVAAGTGFVSLSAGAETTCGLKADGSVLCWGDAEYGQTNVPPGTYKQISSGVFFTCGVRTDGSVVCWGSDFANVKKVPAGNYTQVSAGNGYACALNNSGSIVCWGRGAVVTSVPSGTFTQISVGSSFSACALSNGGSIVCWGDGYRGPELTHYRYLHASERG